VNHFIEGHQQAEEQDQELELEEEPPVIESSVKMYSDALKNLKGLDNFALSHNNSHMFGTISRARIMTDNRAYKSTSYIQKTLLDKVNSYFNITVFVFSACVSFCDCVIN
jgi:hypothetical protein